MRVDVLQHKSLVLNRQAIIFACHVSNSHGGPLKQIRNSRRKQTVSDSIHSYKVWVNLRFEGKYYIFKNRGLISPE